MSPVEKRYAQGQEVPKGQGEGYVKEDSVALSIFGMHKTKG